MNLNQDIFRAYDIRGLAYEDLSKDIVTLIGKSLGSKSLEFGISTIVLGRDGRKSSPDMYEWITDGINQQAVMLLI